MVASSISSASASYAASVSAKPQVAAQDPLARATANLEKEAAKLTERAGQNISSGERQQINASLKAVNEGLKGLADMRTERGGAPAPAAADKGSPAAVNVQLSDKAKAQAAGDDPLARATANLEKQAAKLTERAGQNISSGERQRINSSLKAINEGLKGLADMRGEKAPTPASGNASSPGSSPAPAAKSGSANSADSAVESAIRKNEANRAALNSLERAYGGRGGAVSSRLNLVA